MDSCPLMLPTQHCSFVEGLAALSHQSPLILPSFSGMSERESSGSALSGSLTSEADRGQSSRQLSRLITYSVLAQRHTYSTHTAKRLTPSLPFYLCTDKYCMCMTVCVYALKAGPKVSQQDWSNTNVFITQDLRARLVILFIGEGRIWQMELCSHIVGPVQTCIVYSGITALSQSGHYIWTFTWAPSQCPPWHTHRINGAVLRSPQGLRFSPL